MKLKEKLKEDDRFRRYKRIVKGMKEGIDIEKMDSEIMRLHTGRLSRQMYGKNPSVDTLLKASLQESSVRSRMAEIRVELSKNLSLLEKAVKEVRKYLMSEYREYVTNFRTKGERIDFFDSQLNSGISMISQIEGLVSRIDFLIKDIDQTSYSLTRTRECLELLYAHKSSVPRTSV